MIPKVTGKFPRVPKANMIGKDSDHDGVFNGIDCYPYDKRRQGNREVEDELREYKGRLAARQAERKILNQARMAVEREDRRNKGTKEQLLERKLKFIKKQRKLQKLTREKARFEQLERKQYYKNLKRSPKYFEGKSFLSNSFETKKEKQGKNWFNGGSIF